MESDKSPKSSQFKFSHQNPSQRPFQQSPHSSQPIPILSQKKNSIEITPTHPKSTHPSQITPFSSQKKDIISQSSPLSLLPEKSQVQQISQKNNSEPKKMPILDQTPIRSRSDSMSSKETTPINLSSGKTIPLSRSDKSRESLTQKVQIESDKKSIAYASPRSQPVTSDPQFETPTKFSRPEKKISPQMIEATIALPHSSQKAQNEATQIIKNEKNIASQKSEVRPFDTTIKQSTPRQSQARRSIEPTLELPGESQANPVNLDEDKSIDSQSTVNHSQFESRISMSLAKSQRISQIEPPMDVMISQKIIKATMTTPIQPKEIRSQVESQAKPSQRVVTTQTKVTIENKLMQTPLEKMKLFNESQLNKTVEKISQSQQSLMKSQIQNQEPPKTRGKSQKSAANFEIASERNDDYEKSQAEKIQVEKSPALKSQVEKTPNGKSSALKSQASQTKSQAFQELSKPEPSQKDREIPPQKFSTPQNSQKKVSFSTQKEEEIKSITKELALESPNPKNSQSKKIPESEMIFIEPEKRTTDRASATQATSLDDIKKLLQYDAKKKNLASTQPNPDIDIARLYSSQPSLSMPYEEGINNIKLDPIMTQIQTGPTIDLKSMLRTVEKSKEELEEERTSTDGKKYTLYEDWCILSVMNHYRDINGTTGLSSSHLWNNLKYHRNLLNGTRSAFSMRNRYMKLKEDLTNENWEKIKLYVQRNGEEILKKRCLRFRKDRQVSISHINPMENKARKKKIPSSSSKKKTLAERQNENDEMFGNIDPHLKSSTKKSLAGYSDDIESKSSTKKKLLIDDDICNLSSKDLKFKRITFENSFKSK